MLPERLRASSTSRRSIRASSVASHQHRDGRGRGDELAQDLQPFGSQKPGTKLMPVTLPPGRLRLATSPSTTGSLPVANTIGTVMVAALAASAALTSRQ